MSSLSFRESDIFVLLLFLLLWVVVVVVVVVCVKERRGEGEAVGGGVVVFVLSTVEVVFGKVVVSSWAEKCRQKKKWTPRRKKEKYTEKNRESDGLNKTNRYKVGEVGGFRWVLSLFQFVGGLCKKKKKKGGGGGGGRT